jgi:uncharacterized protein YhfF
MDQRSPAVREFWLEFCRRHGVAADQRYDVFAFGDSAELADELSALVVHGPKRATAGLLSDFGPDGEPLPEVGVHSVVLDGAGRPVCVIRTTEVVVKPVGEVDAAFAWDEGEGDRTLDDWLAGHRAYFTRDLGRRGLPYSDDLPAVFERFELAWDGGAGAGPAGVQG